MQSEEFDQIVLFLSKNVYPKHIQQKDTRKNFRVIVA